MKKSLLLVLVLAIVFIGVVVLVGSDESSQTPSSNKNVTSSKVVSVNPVKHATAVLNWDDNVVYVDPVGGSSTFSAYQSPDLVFVTHTHGDHFDVETLNDVVVSSTEIVVPQTVANQLPDRFSGQVRIMDNGDQVSLQDFSIEAIPMYNLPTSTDAYHVKGDGNGYVIEREGYRVYIAGDTSGIDQMRDLSGVDMAFVPMNLPYTMDVQEAADAVVDFAPEVVYPYHYRNQDDTLSNVERFKELVESENSDIEVRLLDWYPDMN